VAACYFPRSLLDTVVGYEVYMVHALVVVRTALAVCKFLVGQGVGCHTVGDGRIVDCYAVGRVAAVLSNIHYMNMHYTAAHSSDIEDLDSL
jgi:hypothetical protein